MTPADLQKIFPSAPGVGTSPRDALIKYFLVFLLIVTAGLHLKSAFLFQISQNKGSAKVTFQHSLTLPGTLVALARDEHVQKDNLDAALVLYNKALNNFILHLPAWTGLVEILDKQGKKSDAKKALTFIHSKFKNNEDITWSKVQLAKSLGDEKILTESLVWMSQNFPLRKNEIFAAAYGTWTDPNVLMRKFGPKLYPDILNQYIKNDKFNDALIVWNKTVKENAIEPPIAFQYIDYLVDQRAYQLAAKVWSETVGKDAPLIYNGNFENILSNSGFGWRLSKGQGYSWNKGEYGTGLEITFDGSSNLAFQLHQILPISTGKYVLSWTVETDELTTDQLPFWQVQGVHCSGLNAQSEMVLPNQHISEFVLYFTVPETCELARVSLLRRPSSHHDNLISGTITVNKLSIQPADIEHDQKGLGAEKEQLKTQINMSDILVQQ